MWTFLIRVFECVSEYDVNTCVNYRLLVGILPPSAIPRPAVYRFITSDFRNASSSSMAGDVWRPAKRLVSL